MPSFSLKKLNNTIAITAKMIPIIGSALDIFFFPFGTDGRSFGDQPSLLVLFLSDLLSEIVALDFLIFNSACSS